MYKFLAICLTFALIVISTWGITIKTTSKLMKNIDPLAQQIYVVDNAKSNIDKDKAIADLIKQYYLKNATIYDQH